MTQPPEDKETHHVNQTVQSTPGQTHPGAPNKPHVVVEAPDAFFFVSPSDDVLALIDLVRAHARYTTEGTAAALLAYAVRLGRQENIMVLDAVRAPRTPSPPTGDVSK